MTHDEFSPMSQEIFHFSSSSMLTGLTMAVHEASKIQKFFRSSTQLGLLSWVMVNDKCSILLRYGSLLNTMSLVRVGENTIFV